MDHTTRLQKRNGLALVGKQWIYSYGSGTTTEHLPITMVRPLLALISGVGYATNTFQRETILDNSTVTISRNGNNKDGAYILIVGTL